MNPAGATCASCSAPLVSTESSCAACGAPAPTTIVDPARTITGHPVGHIDEATFAALVQKALGGAFEIGTLVGQGGFGSVYAARDLKLQRDVAVKVLRPELLGTGTFVERFLREARIIAQLRHPGIVPVFQIGEGEGLIWFVMPLVKGRSLRALLTAQGRVPVAETRRILSETAAALAVAHDAGVIHRDIKPENIMLEGWDRRVQLMDFGISRSFDAPPEMGLTATGMIIGTVEYMSPEQAAGEVAIDQRSDLYALGLVGYEMLAGKGAFAGDTPQAILVQRLLVEPPDLVAIRPDIPPDVSAAIMKCLQKDRAARWSSVREFAKAIDGSTEGASPRPLVPSAEVPGPTTSRHRRSAILGLGLAAVVSVILALFTFSNRSIGDSPGAGSNLQLKSNDTPSAGRATGNAPSIAAESAVSTPLAAPARSDGSLADIAKLIGDGRPRTALARLDQMRERRPDARVDALIIQAVRAEVESQAEAGNFDQALATLRGHVQARPYLEGLVADAGAIELRQIADAVDRYPNSDPDALLRRLERAHPNDLPLLLAATGRLAGARGYDVRYAGFEGFGRIMQQDPRQRDKILPYVRAELERRWVNNSALSLVLGHFYADLLPELEGRLGSDNDTLRQNAYVVLREADRSRHDLFEFHRKNLSGMRRYAPAEYVARVQTPLGWAISYFTAMPDTTRIREAITLLGPLRGAPELSKATGLIDNALVKLRAKLDKS